MAISTRTKTGTIIIPKYDHSSLQLKGENRSLTPPQHTGPKQSQNGKKTGLRKTGGKGLGHGPKKRRGGSKEKESERPESILRNVKLEEPPRPTVKGPHDDSVTFWPPVAFGEHEKEGLR